MRPTRAEIDLEAIRHNIRLLRQASANAANLTAVVKANGYGHGAVKVSRAALEAGADCLAVAIPEEGAELRAAGITAPIFVLGLVADEQADLVAANSLIASVCTADGARALGEAARRQKTGVKVMLKIDTGMGRIGVAPEKAPAFFRLLLETPGLEPVGAATHFATADEADKTYTLSQIERFRTAVAPITAAHKLQYISAANSAGVIDSLADDAGTVRPGVAIYGLPPSRDMHRSLDLQPAMTFKTSIIYIKKAPPGTCVSYGRTYTTDRETFLATLPVGYADGYSRHLSNKSHVLIGGKRRPVVGRICMDQLLVDLGPVCDAAVGDQAVLFGRQGAAEITVTELADLSGTINYELVCRVSPRVPRLYINEH